MLVIPRCARDDEGEGPASVVRSRPLVRTRLPRTAWRLPVRRRLVGCDRRRAGRAGVARAGWGAGLSALRTARAGELLERRLLAGGVGLVGGEGGAEACVGVGVELTARLAGVVERVAERLGRLV